MSAPPPVPQPENVAAPRVVGVALAAVALFALASWGAWLISGSARPERAAGAPAQLGRAEMGIVNQRPFPLEDGAVRLHAAQHARLEGYGWVDRDAGLIHVPVERAMERLAPADPADGGAP